MMEADNMNYTELMAALKLMWQGMLSIFIVMTSIAVIVYLFVRICKAMKK